MTLLLDEHLSPKLVEIVRALVPGFDIESIIDWKDGQVTNRPDEQILRAAVGEGRTLVTVDLRTIPPILAEFAVSGEDHAGVIFVSTKSFAFYIHHVVKALKMEGGDVTAARVCGIIAKQLTDDTDPWKPPPGPQASRLPPAPARAVYTPCGI